MKRTIKYISSLKWLSQNGVRSSVLQLLRSEIQYIAVKSSDCVLCFNLSPKQWLEQAKRIIKKNPRARVAARLLIALPNDLANSQALNFVLDFLTGYDFFHYRRSRLENGKRNYDKIPVRLSEEQLGIAIHKSHNELSGEYNLHAHVLILPEINGRKIDIDRQGLSDLHRLWEEYLIEKGYEIYRNFHFFQEQHLDLARMHYDVEVKLEYLANLLMKRYLEVYRKHLEYLQLLEKNIELEEKRKQVFSSIRESLDIEGYKILEKHFAEVENFNNLSALLNQEVPVEREPYYSVELYLVYYVVVQWLSPEEKLETEKFKQGFFYNFFIESSRDLVDVEEEIIFTSKRLLRSFLENFKLPELITNYVLPGSLLVTVDRMIIRAEIWLKNEKIKELYLSSNVNCQVVIS